MSVVVDFEGPRCRRSTGDLHISRDVDITLPFRAFVNLLRVKEIAATWCVRCFDQYEPPGIPVIICSCFVVNLL